MFVHICKMKSRQKIVCLWKFTLLYYLYFVKISHMYLSFGFILQNCDSFYYVFAVTHAYNKACSCNHMDLRNKMKIEAILNIYCTINVPRRLELTR